MPHTPHNQRGYLFDLAPDGLAFISPVDTPNHVLAFTLNRLKLKSFEEAGLHEGGLVEYQLDEKRQIGIVTPIDAALALPG
jgi:hypothetical protein